MLSYNPSVNVKYLLLFSALLVSSCGINVSRAEVSTPTTFLVTSTLPVTFTPPPSFTLPPPPSTATLAPLQGTTMSQVNVREGPSTASASLGIVDAYVKVQVTGRDAGSNWYQIIYDKGRDGKGWVTAKYVQMDGASEVPIVGGSAAGSSQYTATVTQQLNVREGPGKDFNGIGTLNPNDVVYLTGKNQTGTWLQIEFTGGKNNKGWVMAAYVQANGVDKLPIVDESGAVVGTETPMGIPATFTPTVIAALDDGDSESAPAVQAIFSPSGTKSLIYTSDLSAPQGDAGDWLLFTTYGIHARVETTCLGAGAATIELTQNGSAIGAQSCGEWRVWNVAAGEAILVHLQIVPTEGLTSTRYTIRIENVR